MVDLGENILLELPRHALHELEGTCGIEHVDGHDVEICG